MTLTLTNDELTAIRHAISINNGAILLRNELVRGKGHTNHTKIILKTMENRGVITRAYANVYTLTAAGRAAWEAQRGGWGDG